MALRGNALFSGSSGLLLVAGARPVGSFMGLNQPVLGVDGPVLLALVGAALLLYAAALALVAARPPVSRKLATAAVILDVEWVVGSAVLLLTTWLPLTAAGRWTVGLLAVAVALIAVAQLYALRLGGRRS